MMQAKEHQASYQIRKMTSLVVFSIDTRIKRMVGDKSLKGISGLSQYLILLIALIVIELLPLTQLLQQVRYDKSQAMIKIDCSPIVEHQITALEIREGQIIEKLLERQK